MGIASPVQGMRVSFALARGRQYGTIVGCVGRPDRWWVEFDDGEELASDLKHDNWRAEPDAVSFVERLHDVRFGPLPEDAELVQQVRLEVTNAVGDHIIRGGTMTFRDPCENANGLSFAIDPITNRRDQEPIFKRIERIVAEPRMRLLPKVRWSVGAHCLYFHVFFQPKAAA